MLTALLLVAGLAAALLLAGIVIRLARPLPPLEPRTPSCFIPASVETPLGRSAARQRADHADDLSGLHMLVDGKEAFATRILLAHAAVHSLDIRYYIWHADTSGTLLLDAVRDAARRGVRVRMLLDDNGIAGLDAVLATLDGDPNVEVRLFNPFTVRRPKMLGYLADFLRLNRRMHNKSFTADGAATIVGGRNLGDEYFDARDMGLFADVDVLAVGPIVDDVARDFDRYWSCGSAYPAARILPAVERDALEALHRRIAQDRDDPRRRAYMDAVTQLPFIDQLVAGTLAFEWAPVRMLSDDPAKGLGRARKGRLLTDELARVMGEPHEQLRVVSGYFVPTAAGTRAFSALARGDIDVAVFTNAFEATDVWIVHAGYAGYRKALLRAGVRLFEMRGGREGDEGGRRRGRRKLLGTGSTGFGGSRRPGGSARAGQVLRSAATTLHAKTFAIDRRQLFIGSFNFDPRSMHLNTELGFVIESPTLAARVSETFDETVPGRAYEVTLGAGGRLAWIERTPDGSIVHTSEPGTNAAQRGAVWLLSHLPIEWLL